MAGHHAYVPEDVRKALDGLSEIYDDSILHHIYDRWKNTKTTTFYIWQQSNQRERTKHLIEYHYLGNDAG